jgi:transcriptional regulator with XRE-family HTH domain
VSKQPPAGEPIPTTLRQLMDEQHLSYRALAGLTRGADPDGRGVSHAYLCALVAGREYPSRRAIQLLATSLHIDPDRFAEYRIAELRAELNGREVGFQAAWRRYLELVS